MVNKEFESSSNQVFDRKPVRRRIARDIYFVFEEGKKSYSKMKGSSKDKSKFGHLKVGQINKSDVYASKNIYSVKNKRKCFVNASYTLDHNACYTTQSSPIQFPVSHLPIAKVNPIFVWVKQDDTTIVEVRCEDYDKRNRIRLTKTLNGWRATPRTDPTSSRVVKLIPKNCREISLASVNEKKEKIKTSLPKAQQKCNNTNELNEGEILNQINFDSNDTCNLDQSNEMVCRNKANTQFSANIDLKLTIEVAAEGTQSPEISEINDNNNLNISKNNLYTSEITEFQLCPKTGLFISKERSDLEEEFFKINDIILDLEDSDVLNLKEQPNKHQDGNTKMLVDLMDESTLLQKSSGRKSHDSESTNSFATSSFFEPTYLNDGSSGSYLIKSLIKENCYRNSMDTYNKIIEKSDEIREITTNLFQQGSDTDILTNIKSSIQASSIYDKIHETDPDKGFEEDLFPTEMSKCMKVDEALEINDIKVDLISNRVSACSNFKDNRDVENLNTNLYEDVASERNHYSVSDEAENVNADLLQNGSFLDTNKRKNLGISNDSLWLPNIATNHNKCHKTSDASSNIASEYPEDLSYRKEERICTFSEAQKSYANVPSNLFKSCLNSGDIFEPTSETINNIFKEISKMAPFNDHKKNRTEEINSENSKNSNYSNDICSNCFETSSKDILFEEPIQKRVRSSLNSHEIHNKIRIKNEPDPLTQLKILIHNSEWKLPDPILVPRELLGAILESPAREIPLLLSTRPELKLPEAFSYPEILKNPNILVISIAQLEAILTIPRTEMESKLHKNDSEKEVNNNYFATRQQEGKRKKNTEALKRNDISIYNQTGSMDYNNISSCLQSNLNAARLALLNKVLQVPYSYGRLSPDVLQFVNDESLCRKKTNDSYFLSLHNSQFSKSSSEIYDNILNLPTNLKQDDHIRARLDNPNRKSEQLPTIELPILEEILQSRMNRVQSINKLISKLDQNIIASTQKPCQKTFALLTSHKDLTYLNEPVVKNKSLLNMASCNSVENSAITKSKNSNIDLRNITLYKNLRNHQTSIEYKPKLTCKSLSNLIYPENIKHATVPLLNLISSNDEFFYKYGGIQHKNITAYESHSSPTSLKAKCAHSRANPNAAENTESSAALWHPLFTGNNKTSYSGPWQWTTITSPGE